MRCVRPRRSVERERERLRENGPGTLQQQQREQQHLPRKSKRSRRSGAHFNGEEVIFRAPLHIDGNITHEALATHSTLNDLDDSVPSTSFLRKRVINAQSKTAASSTMAKEGRSDEEEAALFLPQGAQSRAKRHSAGGRLRSCVALIARRRKAIIFLLLAAALFTQVWMWGPKMLGKERADEWNRKLDQWKAWSPYMRPSGPSFNDRPPSFPPPHLAPPPPPARPDRPAHQPPTNNLPPGHAPPPGQVDTASGPKVLENFIGWSASGNAMYKGNMQLPDGYDTPPTSADEKLALPSEAFPPTVVDFHRKAAHIAVYNYLEGDPHLGEIPKSKLEIIDRDFTIGKPPIRQIDPPQYPASRYKPHPSWTRTADGSRTRMEDALEPDKQPKEADWRPEPFKSWQPPKFDSVKTGLLGFSKSMTNMPTVQYAFKAPDKHSGESDNPSRDEELKRRQRLVRNAFLHSWEAYKAYAWGHDEIQPVSGEPSDNFNGWGATIVDALDTLLVMDLPQEYNFARQHVNDIDFRLLGGARSAYGSSDGRIPVFETAIRYLGGFLSAYDLAGDELMRDRAEELAQLIMPSFETMTGVPVGRLKFDDPNVPFASGSVIVAEAASMLVEFTRLWQVTGNRTYFDRVHRVTDWLQFNMSATPERLGALLPASIFPERGTMYGWYSWGGMIDSAFEYLIKEHQLLGGRIQQYGDFFADSVDSALRWLIRSINSVPRTPLLVFGQSNGRTYEPKLEHLTCFAGGAVGLGGKLLNRKDDIQVARRLTETCYWTYNSTASGVGPEFTIFYADKDADRFEHTQDATGTLRRGKPHGAPVVGVRNMAADYRNRPETIESILYMWRITGDPIWQERGWQMFCSWVTHSMTTYGFSSISSVIHVPVTLTNSQESFVFAETFKYYYLLFSPPNLISLDDYVFTTEAHPLLVPKGGRWGVPGKGPRKFWDPKASHSSVLPDAYSGGEGGRMGGLTRAQQHHIYNAWRLELAAIAKAKAAKEADERARAKAQKNKELLSNQFKRLFDTATSAATAAAHLARGAEDAMSSLTEKDVIGNTEAGIDH